MPDPRDKKTKNGEEDVFTHTFKIIEARIGQAFKEFEKILKFACECCDMKVGKDGLIESPKIKINHMAKLEKSIFSAVHGVVLHRTESSSVDSALTSWENTGLATHFIVDKEGTIYQICSLNNSTSHVGKLQPRCVNENTCTSDERKKIKKMKIMQIHHYEMAKTYPNRYPYNADAIGIEVVGRCLDEAVGKEKWEPVPDAQAKAVACVVRFLLAKFNLSKTADIYVHEQISYKTTGEGKTVYDAIKELL